MKKIVIFLVGIGISWLAAKFFLFWLLLLFVIFVWQRGVFSEKIFAQGCFSWGIFYDLLRGHSLGETAFFLLVLGLILEGGLARFKKPSLLFSQK